ncbi:MAG: hypothetical protein ACPGOV_04230 [Magnetovibrionaceae bacterium]
MTRHSTIRLSRGENVYLLYYAGMARGEINEQIGLAVSEDGLNFRRHGETGLIIPRDENLPWKSLEVCNPHVEKVGGRYLMLYQGISRDQLNTSIGLASSPDGFEWTCEPDPSLSYSDMAELDPNYDPTHRAAAIEPCFMATDNGYRIWFIYRHPSYPGNALFHARSQDLKKWQVDPEPVLTGKRFFRSTIWYPQIRRAANGQGYDLYLTVRGIGHGIYHATSPDGFDFGPFHRVMGGGFDLHNFAQNLGPLHGLRHRLSPPWLWGYRKVVSALAGLGLKDTGGLAHAHVLDEADGKQRLYLHSYGRDEAGRTYMEVSVTERTGRGAFTGLRRVFRRPSDPEAWDAQFVADPFVIKTDV